MGQAAGAGRSDAAGRQGSWLGRTRRAPPAGHRQPPRLRRRATQRCRRGRRPRLRRLCGAAWPQPAWPGRPRLPAARRGPRSLGLRVAPPRLGRGGCTAGHFGGHGVSGIQVAQGTLWDEAPIEVALAAYDVTLASTSAGKDSSAMLAHLVARARVEGVLDRVVAVHADLGVIEWPATRQLAERQARALGVPRFEVVRRRTRWAVRGSAGLLAALAEVARCQRPVVHGFPEAWADSAAAHPPGRRDPRARTSPEPPSADPQLHGDARGVMRMVWSCSLFARGGVEDRGSFGHSGSLESGVDVVHPVGAATQCPSRRTLMSTMACSGDGTAVTLFSRWNRWASRIVSAAMVAIVVVDLLVIQERPGASMAGSHFSITSLASCAPTAASPIVAAGGVSSTMRRVA